MHELLVPVGSMEALNVAIHSGADAVYLGGKKFGARAYATNFDDEEMVQAIKLAHLYGVKVYVTVNTMIYESELESAYQYIKFLHQNGVDAIIISDLGLIAKVRRCLPNLELHASTQVHNHNSEGVKYLKKLGVKRVVFAREMSIDEIKDIETDLDKEIFIHGALCVSYSGQCLFSAMKMERSGNRGSCSQMCRLPYKLMVDGKDINCNGEYLLSTKELNIGSNIKELLDMDGFVSLKIEGRMKSPEYVGCVTRYYRDLIDKYENDKEVTEDSRLLNDLSVIFNRKFTEGFLFKTNSNDLMNIESCNHVGISLGKVIRVTNKRVFIRLNRDLNQGDGIRFNESGEGMFVNFLYDTRDNLINCGHTGEVVAVDNKFDIEEDTTVNKTSDIMIQKYYTNIEQKRIPVSIKLSAHIGENLKATISDGENSFDVIGSVVERAQNAPMEETRILEQLSKLGNTAFKLENHIIDIDNNIFLSIKEINELRRELVDKLTESRENKKVDVLIDEVTEKVLEDNDDTKYISVLVRTDEQMEAAKRCNVDRIIVDNVVLFNKYKDLDNLILRTPRVYSGKDIDYKQLLVTELGCVNKYPNNIVDYYLNIANHETIDLLSENQSLLTLSVETPLEEVRNIMNYYNYKKNLEVVVYSNVELMIMKYCPLKLLVNKDDVCHVCQDGKKYYLKDRNNELYRLINEPINHITHIMNSRVMNKYEDVSEYEDMGITNFRIELLEQNFMDSVEIINNLKKKLNK